MTINKAQGQSVQVVGLDLSGHVFGHGQLYVGLGRGTDPDLVKALAAEADVGPRGSTMANIVYREVLDL